MQKKKPVLLDSRAGFRAVWGPNRVGLRVLHSFQRGRLCGCVLRVSGMPPGGLIVGVRVVLGVLLPVLRRGVVLLICA